MKPLRIGIASLCIVLVSSGCSEQPRKEAPTEQEIHASDSGDGSGTPGRHPYQCDDNRALLIDFKNDGGETSICGNPPYLGAKKKSASQTDDMDAVGLPQSVDYVTAFIAKGVEYSRHSLSEIALVSTSSICQGEQVSDFWPGILQECRISFAYRPFRWANSAANNAGVFCTIIGLDRNSAKRARLFDNDSEKVCDQISPYLIEGPPVICTPARDPLSGAEGRGR